MVAYEFRDVILDSAEIHDEVYSVEDCERHRLDLERRRPRRVRTPIADDMNQPHWPDPVAATCLYQSFTQDLVLEEISGIASSAEFEELAIELAAGLGITPQRAGSLLHRIVQGARTRVRGMM